MVRFFRNIFHQIGNFFFWGWKLKNSWDWDHGFLLEIIRFKLERMERFFDTKAFSVEMSDPRSVDRRSLSIVIRLLKRLDDRFHISYAKYANKKHAEKWGEFKIIHGKPDERGLSPLTVTREKVTELNKHEYERDSLKNREFNDKIYRRDVKLLFDILHKYHEYWWD